jgi:hypothetical protein
MKLRRNGLALLRALLDFWPMRTAQHSADSKETNARVSQSLTISQGPPYWISFLW